MNEIYLMFDAVSISQLVSKGIYILQLSRILHCAHH